MKKKLLRLALASSPILAIYGAAPVFLFTHLTTLLLFGAFFTLTLLILLFWLINIWLAERQIADLRRYFFSYLLTVLLHYVLIFLAPIPLRLSEDVNFYIYPLIAILAINSIILIVIHSFILAQDKERAESELKNVKMSNLEAQKQILLQQLQPHFLFNALSTLKSMIRQHPAEAEDYSVRLSEFLRYSIQAPAREWVSLEEEWQFTQDYLELQKMRFGEALRCEIDLPADIRQWKLPVFALQTLVENAIKHNSFTEKKPLYIQIRWAGQGLRVANSLSPKQLTPSSGTGLANLKQRYRLMSGQEIKIEGGEKEFVVFIPLFQV